MSVSYGNAHLNRQRRTHPALLPRQADEGPSWLRYQSQIHQKVSESGCKTSQTATSKREPWHCGISAPYTCSSFCPLYINTYPIVIGGVQVCSHFRARGWMQLQGGASDQWDSGTTSNVNVSSCQTESVFDWPTSGGALKLGDPARPFAGPHRLEGRAGGRNVSRAADLNPADRQKATDRIRISTTLLPTTATKP